MNQDKLAAVAKVIGTGQVSEMSAAEILGKAINGDRHALARSLTLLENGDLTESDIASLSINSSTVLGITGAPGVGKSCIIDHIVQKWIKDGYKVAVIAVDPTSPITGGALLGDRLRMSNADTEDNVYVRSIATRRHGGSVPGVVANMLTLLSASGWDKCIVETVGAGQGEIRVAAVADQIVLIEAPGRGDGVQAEKAGLIELADMIVVNKADLDGSQRAADEIRQSLEAGSLPVPPIVLASAANGSGISEMIDSIDSLKTNERTARARARERIRAAWEQKLLDHEMFEELLEKLVSGEINSTGFVELIMGEIE